MGGGNPVKKVVKTITKPVKEIAKAPVKALKSITPDLPDMPATQVEENKVLDDQVIEATKEAEKEESAIDAEKERKKSARRRGLVGARSLFGRAGGRGYFDPIS